MIPLCDSFIDEQPEGSLPAVGGGGPSEPHAPDWQEVCCRRTAAQPNYQGKERDAHKHQPKHAHTHTLSDAVHLSLPLVKRCDKHFGRPEGCTARSERRAAARETRLPGTHTAVRKGQGIVGGGKDWTKEPHNTGRKKTVLLYIFVNVSSKTMRTTEEQSTIFY